MSNSVYVHTFSLSEMAVVSQRAVLLTDSPSSVCVQHSSVQLHSQSERRKVQALYSPPPSRWVRFFPRRASLWEKHFVCCALWKNVSACCDLCMAADLLESLAPIPVSQYGCVWWSLPHHQLIQKSCTHDSSDGLNTAQAHFHWCKHFSGSDFSRQLPKSASSTIWMVEF